MQDDLFLFLKLTIQQLNPKLQMSLDNHRVYMTIHPTPNPFVAHRQRSSIKVSIEYQFLLGYKIHPLYLVSPVCKMGIEQEAEEHVLC